MSFKLVRTETIKNNQSESTNLNLQPSKHRSVHACMVYRYICAEKKKTIHACMVYKYICAEKKKTITNILLACMHLSKCNSPLSLHHAIVQIQCVKQISVSTWGTYNVHIYSYDHCLCNKQSCNTFRRKEKKPRAKLLQVFLFDKPQYHKHIMMIVQATDLHSQCSQMTTSKQGAKPHKCLKQIMKGKKCFKQIMKMGRKNNNYINIYKLIQQKYK